MRGARRSRTTIVTALFDIPAREGNSSRRRVEEYLRLGGFVLRQPRPVVVVCDPALSGAVERARAVLAPALRSTILHARCVAAWHARSPDQREANAAARAKPRAENAGSA